MSQPANNNVDLSGQQAQFNQEQQLQQQQWQASNTAAAQANSVANALGTQQVNQTSQQTTALTNQDASLNAAQGAAKNATGGASGEKAANTLLNSTLGLSPAQLKLQAAGQAQDPNSLTALMAQRAASTGNIQPSGNSLNSVPVKLGGG